MNRWGSSRGLLFRLTVGGLTTILITGLLWLAALGYYFKHTRDLDVVQETAGGFTTGCWRRGGPRRIPVVVVTSKDLTEEDRLRLSGYVQKVVQKGGYDRERLLVELQDLLLTTTARRADAAPGTPGSP